MARPSSSRERTGAKALRFGRERGSGRLHPLQAQQEHGRPRARAAPVHEADVSDLAAVEGLTEASVARFGRLDVMVDNSAVSASSIARAARRNSAEPILRWWSGRMPLPLAEPLPPHSA